MGQAIHMYYKLYLRYRNERWAESVSLMKKFSRTHYKLYVRWKGKSKKEKKRKLQVGRNCELITFSKFPFSSSLNPGEEGVPSYLSKQESLHFALMEHFISTEITSIISGITYLKCSNLYTSCIDCRVHYHENWTYWHPKFDWFVKVTAENEGWGRE